MLLNAGEKIFVAHRRLFEKDSIRFFVGTVDHFEDGIVRTTGHSYVRDNFSGSMLEKPEERTKLLSISSGTLIVYVIPAQVMMADLKFTENNGMLMMQDGKGFTMNLSDALRTTQM